MPLGGADNLAGGPSLQKPSSSSQIRQHWLGHRSPEMTEPWGDGAVGSAA